MKTNSTNHSLICSSLRNLLLLSGHNTSRVCLLLAALLIICINTKTYAQEPIDSTKTAKSISKESIDSVKAAKALLRKITDSVGSYYDANDRLIHPEFTLEQAKSVVKQRIKHLSLPKLFLPDYGQDTLDKILGKEPELDWDNYISGGAYDRFVLYEIPIKTDYHFYNKIYYTERFPGEEGTTITHVALERVKSRSNLLIRYYPKRGSTIILVVTVVGNSRSSELNKDPENAWDYTGNKRNFHGYEIFTDINGNFVSCFYYENHYRYNVNLQPYMPKDGFYAMFTLPDIGIVSRASNYIFPSEHLKSFEELHSYICPKCNTFLNDGYCSKCNHWEYENVIEAVMIPNSKVGLSRHRGR